MDDAIGGKTVEVCVGEHEPLFQGFTGMLPFHGGRAICFYRRLLEANRVAQNMQAIDQGMLHPYGGPPMLNVRVFQSLFYIVDRRADDIMALAKLNPVAHRPGCHDL